MADRDELIDDALAKVSDLGTVGAMKWLASALLKNKMESNPSGSHFKAMTDAPDRIYLVIEDGNGTNPFADFHSAQKAANAGDGLTWCEDRQGPSDIEYVLAQPAAVEPANNGGEIPTAPDHCPITGRKFWGNIDHPEFGMVATYGGPFDTYTIPKPDEDGEFRCEQFDQDAGDWVEGGCPTGLWLADEQPAASDVRDVIEEIASAVEQFDKRATPKGIASAIRTMEIQSTPAVQAGEVKL